MNDSKVKRKVAGGGGGRSRLQNGGSQLTGDTRLIHQTDEDQWADPTAISIRWQFLSNGEMDGWLFI